MPTRDSGNWMWAQACELLDQAERMHRQFFRLAAAGQSRVAWEPPVDILEDDRIVTVIVALPGVPAEGVEIATDRGMLTVRATRRMPFLGSGAAVRRVEIPYGIFERRMPLPESGIDDITHQFVNGCLILQLRKAGQP